MLAHKQKKLTEMVINRERFEGSIKILDELVTPESVKNEKMAFDKAFDTMYPKTGEIRKKLIKYNLRNDRVTPRLEKSKLHLIFEPKEGWFDKYPKTAGKRLAIVEGKKPQKPSLLTRFKNVFKSAKKLQEEKELKITAQKIDYDIMKIANAVKP